MDSPLSCPPQSPANVVKFRDADGPVTVGLPGAGDALPAVAGPPVHPPARKAVVIAAMTVKARRVRRSWRGLDIDQRPSSHGGWYGRPGAYWSHCAGVTGFPVLVHRRRIIVPGSISSRSTSPSGRSTSLSGMVIDTVLPPDGAEGRLTVASMASLGSGPTVTWERSAVSQMWRTPWESSPTRTSPSGLNISVSWIAELPDNVASMTGCSGLAMDQSLTTPLESSVASREAVG